MADTDYVAKLAKMESAAGVASRVKNARTLLVKYGSWLRRYHGGLPVGIFAAIMEMESGGKMGAPGDVSLGEVGFYQITSSFPAEVGLPAESRYDPETNVFLGGLEYQVEAAKAAKQWPGIVTKGSVDQWKLARLSFAIGWGGTRDFVTRAFADSSSGSPYQRVLRYADKTGGRPYGSQSATKVWYRVHVVDYNFRVGQQVSSGFYGPPQIIPAPPKYPRYTFPASLLPFTGKPGNIGLVVAATLAFVGYALARRF